MITRTASDMDIAGVGRVGELVLQYVHQGSKTILSHARSRSPWHFLPPIVLDDGSAYTNLINPSGGLVGGDRLSTRITLNRDAHVVVSTPSANRVYRSVSETAVQLFDLTVSSGAILEWFPEHTIPFTDSRFRQVIHVRLYPGATIVLWDAIAAGRIARGERWRFASLENEIRIVTASRGYLLERYHIKGLEPLQDRLLSGWDYMASLYVVNDRITSDVWNSLNETLAVLLDTGNSQVFGATSEPAIPGLAIRLVARTAPDLHAICQNLWGAVRAGLWKLPLPDLRRR
ncbi:MAG TPA: urease accessory protein UreD [Nitrospirales bacterium]